MYIIDFESFESIVYVSVEALPAVLRSRVENVSFAVEEHARRDDYAAGTSPATGTLLGVYRGIPLTRRGSGYNFTLPDTIVIFRAPLQQLARDEAHLAELIRHTVHHEIAHHFGISDERLHELGAY